MKKKVSLLHSVLLLIAAIFTGLAVFMLFSLTSCKKNDFNTTEAVGEERFFTEHRSVDPIENVLVEYIRRKNERLNFVGKTANQIGYPRWDKTIIIKNKNNHTSSRDPHYSSATIYCVPFVRDSQNYVNASMIISISGADTAFSYLCDWQYRSKIYGLPTTDTTAEQYALFFMVLNRSTLGHKTFNIVDTTLFTSLAPSITGSKRIGLLDSGNENSNSTNRLAQGCIDWYFCGTPDICRDLYGSNGCDYTNCPTDECFLMAEYCFDLPGGGGGDDYPDDLPPGGGGGGGGGTPPTPCDGPSGLVAGRGNEPCVDPPGWEPEPWEDEPVNKTPCDKMLPIKQQSDSNLLLQSLWTNINSTNPQLKRETGFGLFSTQAPLYFQGPLITGNNIPQLNISLEPNCIGFIHTHPNYSNKMLPIFSPDDFVTAYKALQIRINNEPVSHYTTFVMGVLNWRGESYFMVIDNYDDFARFGSKYELLDYVEDNSTLENIYRKYNITHNSTSSDAEVNFLKFLKNLNTGIKVLKSDNNFTNFSQLTLNGDQVISTPCN